MAYDYRNDEQRRENWRNRHLWRGISQDYEAVVEKAFDAGKSDGVMGIEDLVSASEALPTGMLTHYERGMRQGILQAKKLQALADKPVISEWPNKDQQRIDELQRRTTND